MKASGVPYRADRPAFGRDLVKGKPAGTPPPRYLTVLGWLLASVAAVLFIFLVLVVIGTS